MGISQDTGDEKKGANGQKPRTPSAELEPQQGPPGSWGRVGSPMIQGQGEPPETRSGPRGHSRQV